MKKLILTIAIIGSIIGLIFVVIIKYGQYNPKIDPQEFSTEITNPYMSLQVGKKMVYESNTPDGKERIEILVPGWTKNIMGVETLVYWDRVYLDGELIEDTRDYLAQNTNTGDVWYFGEDVDNYENGKFVDNEGAWIYGNDGAKPGIWMSASPEVGQSYRQEYYVDFAEDEARVDGIYQHVAVPAGDFTDCVKIYEFSRLFSATAYKFHCKEVGGTALEVDLPDPPDSQKEQRTELVEVDYEGALNIDIPRAYKKQGLSPAISNP